MENQVIELHLGLSVESLHLLIAPIQTKLLLPKDFSIGELNQERAPYIMREESENTAEQPFHIRMATNFIRK